ncbi:MAG: hypothetical protein KGY48_11570 [Wenzhouxiangellaceae bacterium]|nr:hypothetical protein [Wenzhouxiangellaceae bacterium]MBS3745906.1 hypothetical protein [Wenzhouxiangellaceae bacterium]MBS3822858.1 hypothetical protein [Wenzhouxiangellaceae bacterium]
MKTAPAILLMIAGAALAGGLPEWLSITDGRQTPGLQELVIVLAEWLCSNLPALAELIQDRY